MNIILRAARPMPLSMLYGPDRQRLTLFVVLAAWTHLLAFMAIAVMGVNIIFKPISIAPPKESFLELSLEINQSALPVALTEELPTVGQEPAQPPPTESFSDAGQEVLTPHQPLSFPPLPSDETLIPNESTSSSPAAGDNTINLEQTAPKFKSYNTTVRSAVARHWILPPEARSNFQPGRFTAVMTLDRSGEVMLIMVEESSGSPSLDFAAMEALRGAAPYQPFPEELSEYDQLNFRLHFDYRAVHKRAGNSR
ncbi:MAG: TonB family protein [Deltaproteobacteria bacterium]|jgi:TonB family protein|nr:TonB family protein [Deltaproteobacteria bacterium]